MFLFMCTNIDASDKEELSDITEDTGQKSKDNESDSQNTEKNASKYQLALLSHTGIYDPELLPYLINVSTQGIPENSIAGLSKFGYGIEVKFDHQKKQILLKIQSPNCFFEPKGGQDPFKVGNETDTRLMGIGAYQDLKNKGFAPQLPLILTAYEKNCRPLDIKLNKDKQNQQDLLFTSISLEENKIPVKNIVIASDVPDHIANYIIGKFKTKRSNWFLNMLGKIMDSPHIKNNNQEEDIRFILSSFFSYGYFKSSLINYLCITNNRTNQCSFLYSVFSNKKFHIKNIHIHSETLNSEERRQIIHYLSFVFKELDFKTKDLHELNSLLHGFAVQVTKVKIRNIQNDTCDLYFLIERIIKTSYIENILLKEFDNAPIDKLLNFLAKKYNLYVSAAFDERSYQQALHDLQQITGTQPNHQETLRSGYRLTITGGAKPPKWKFGEQLIQVNFNNIIINPVIYQKFFLFRQLSKLTWKPQISARMSNNFFNSISVVSDLSLKFFGSINYELQFKVPIPIIAMISSAFHNNKLEYNWEVPTELNFEIKKERDQYDLSLLFSIQKISSSLSVLDALFDTNEDLKKAYKQMPSKMLNQYGIIVDTLKIRKNNLYRVCIPDMLNIAFNYVFYFGNTPHSCSSADLNIDIFVNTRSFGVPIIFRVGKEIQIRTATILYSLLFATSPIIHSDYTLFTLDGRFRLIGLNEEACQENYQAKTIVSNYLALFRFFILREIWSSARVINIAMMNLQWGFFFNCAVFNRITLNAQQINQIDGLYTTKNQIRSAFYNSLQTGWNNRLDNVLQNLVTFLDKITHFLKCLYKMFHIFGSLGLMCAFDMLGIITMFIAIYISRFGPGIDIGVIQQVSKMRQTLLMKRRL